MRICETLNSQTPVQTTAHAYPIEAMMAQRCFLRKQNKKSLLPKHVGQRATEALSRQSILHVLQLSRGVGRVSHTKGSCATSNGTPWIDVGRRKRALYAKKNAKIILAAQQVIEIRQVFSQGLLARALQASKLPRNVLGVNFCLNY